MAASVVASCGSDRGDVTTAPTAPVRGGTFVIALSSDPGHLNPAISTMGVTHEASELIFNGLVGMDRDLNPVPELATSWSIEQDGTQYRFRLADGVTWHDGKPFTAADVKFTFEELLLKFHGRTRASLRPSLDAIETPDEQTVVFRFKQPYAPLLRQLDVTEAPILPRHLYAGGDPERNPANLRPIGTGPFKFASFNQNLDLTLVRNPAYFKPGLPHLDTVKMRIMPDAAARVLALQAGEVDWIHEREGFGSDTEKLQSDARLKLLTSPWTPGGANCVMTISFNLDRPIFADLRVRRAVHHALDRRRFLDDILFGQGAIADAPISSGIGWAHSSDVTLPGFDPREAERLLEAAGWTRGAGGVRTAQSVSGEVCLT